ncbi:MAG: hypothetical protein QOC96_2384 [Acidobacteriota bacterium]|jgi:hypothetical protein|nr:hypothetical protein [Acidobacteriota bacterium]
MPKLPNAERAIVDVAKLRDYSLNPQHHVGKHKARVFLSALDVTLDDAEWLRQTVLEAVRDAEAHLAAPSPFGIKYVVDILVARGERSATVRTAWIVEHGTDFPRLTSCYVK